MRSVIVTNVENVEEEELTLYMEWVTEYEPSVKEIHFSKDRQRAMVEFDALIKDHKMFEKKVSEKKLKDQTVGIIWPLDVENRIVVSELGSIVHGEELSLYFESEKFCPSGGEVGYARIFPEANKAVVAFVDSKVCQAVMKSNHVVSNNKIEVRPFNQLEDCLLEMVPSGKIKTAQDDDDDVNDKDDANDDDDDNDNKRENKRLKENKTNLGKSYQTVVEQNLKEFVQTNVKKSSVNHENLVVGDLDKSCESGDGCLGERHVSEDVGHGAAAPLARERRRRVMTRALSDTSNSDKSELNRSLSLPSTNQQIGIEIEQKSQFFAPESQPDHNPNSIQEYQTVDKRKISTKNSSRKMQHSEVIQLDTAEKTRLLYFHLKISELLENDDFKFTTDLKNKKIKIECCEPSKLEGLAKTFRIKCEEQIVDHPVDFPAELIKKFKCSDGLNWCEGVFKCSNLTAIFFVSKDVAKVMAFCIKTARRAADELTKRLIVGNVVCEGRILKTKQWKAQVKSWEKDRLIVIDVRDVNDSECVVEVTGVPEHVIQIVGNIEELTQCNR